MGLNALGWICLALLSIVGVIMVLSGVAMHDSYVIGLGVLVVAGLTAIVLINLEANP